MLGASSHEPVLSFVALGERDVLLEDLFDLGSERRKVQIPPCRQLLVELLARIIRAEVGEDAPLRPIVQRVAGTGLCCNLLRQLSNLARSSSDSSGIGNRDNSLGCISKYPFAFGAKTFRQ